LPNNSNTFSFGYRFGGIGLNESLFPEKVTDKPGPGQFEIATTIGKSPGVV
jgi:hypothetical protein